MSTPQQKMQAFQSAQKFGKQFPGLIEALEEWATIGSLEQAAEEVNKRLVAMRAEEQALKSTLEARATEAAEAVRKFTADGERDLASRRAAAAVLIEEANIEARRMLDAARAKAAEVTHQAERSVAVHEAKLMATKQELDSVAVRLESKTGELTSITAAVEQMQAQHERFTQLIAGLAAKL